MDQRVDTKSRKRQFLPPEFVRAMLAGHSALGLAFAALIYVVCLTGTLVVFLHELHRWEQPDGPAVSTPVTPEAVAAAFSSGYQQALADNAAHDMSLTGPSPFSQRFSVHYHDHATGARGTWLADEAGRLVTRITVPWSNFIAHLHMSLHMPRTWGKFLVGLTGVALLSSLISGLLSHPRIFKDAFALRWGGSLRLQEADLHNRLGVWGLPFHVAVTLTGALLGLSTLIMGVLALAAYNGDSEEAYGVILGPMATADETAAPLPDLAAMIRQVQASKPDAVFASASIDHVGKAGQVVHLGMQTPGHLAFSNTYYFDGAGKPLGDGGLESGGIGQQILGALQPLHFGWFGGFAVKLAYVLLGLALTIVTHSGVVIWLARRRDKGRPAPGWEKAWAAFTWSQPLAFGTTAIAMLAGAGHDLLPLVYLATMFVSFGIAYFLTDGMATARTLRVLSAMALVGAVAMHVNLWAGRKSDPMGLYVNVAIITCAAVILLPVLRRRRPQ